MVGRHRQERLDRLIDEVARGRRTLASIGDEESREAVRLALRLHRSAPEAPDAYARMRMRARVLAGLEPRRAGLRDIAWTALEQLGRPAPYIVRGVAVAALLLAAGMGMVVASADTLPTDALYPVKLASEQARLLLAVTPDDRAMVELSIADHRLAEAERLAVSGRTADALIASAAYSEQIATAAADLTPGATASLARQLEESFTAQRERAQTLATELSAKETSARAATVLALIAAPAVAPADDPVERVAVTAATVASQLATEAERSEPATPAPAAAPAPATAPARRAVPTPDAPTPGAPTAAATQGAAAPAPDPSSRETPRAAPAAKDRGAAATTPTATASASPTADSRAAEAAKSARRAAQAAQAAVERVRQWLSENRPDGRTTNERGGERGREGK